MRAVSKPRSGRRDLKIQRMELRGGPIEDLEKARCESSLITHEAVRRKKVYTERRGEDDVPLARLLGLPDTP